MPNMRENKQSWSPGALTLAASHYAHEKKNTIVIYSKLYSVFEPYYIKLLEFICCGNSIAAVVI